MEKKRLRAASFDFDTYPEILSDTEIVKLQYSKSDFLNTWTNTDQTLTVVCTEHTVNIPAIFRLFGTI